MKKHFFKLCIREWRIVIANCPVKIKKFRNEMTAKKRRAIKLWLLDRTGGKCEMCGRTVEYGTMSLHHILPVSMAPELSTTKSNMMCLCSDCHRKIHRNPLVYTRQIAEYYPSRAAQFKINAT